MSYEHLKGQKQVKSTLPEEITVSIPRRGKFLLERNRLETENICYYFNPFPILQEIL